MESNKSVKYLIGIIVLLVMGLAASIGYIVGNSNNVPLSQSSISSNDEVMKEIEELKQMYDAKISEKTASFKELKTEKAKVQKLLYELEKTKGDAASLMKYKNEYQNLQSKMMVLVNEITNLKSGKVNAVAKVKTTKGFDQNTQVKSDAFNKKTSTVSKPVTTSSTTTVTNKIVKPETNKVLNPVVKTEKKEDKVEVKQENPQVKTPEAKAVAYKISQLKTTAFQLKSSGKTEEVNLASKTELLKIVFTVDGYQGNNADEKSFYIQIINEKGNVLGKKITEFFDDKTLTYSYIKRVNIANGTVNVVQDIFDTQFVKGTYFVNIFDKSKLVANGSITLK
jgi:hypothetical protein